MQQTISSNGSGELSRRRPHLASYPAGSHAGIKTRPQRPVPVGIALRNPILSSRNSSRADWQVSISFEQVILSKACPKAGVRLKVIKIQVRMMPQTQACRLGAGLTLSEQFNRGFLHVEAGASGQLVELTIKPIMSNFGYLTAALTNGERDHGSTFMFMVGMLAGNKGIDAFQPVDHAILYQFI